MVPCDGRWTWPKNFLHRKVFGRCSSPLITGGKAIFDVGGKNSGMVALVDYREAAWSSTSYGNDYSSAVPLEASSGQLVLSFMREGFLALESKTGKEVFFERRSPISASVNAASPLVADNRSAFVFLLRRWSRLVGLPEKINGRRKFQSSLKKRTPWIAIIPVPVALGEFAYGFHGRQERGPVLRCISLKDGTVAWEAPSMGAGNLIRVKDNLIVLTEDGELILAEASPRDSGLFIGSKFSVRAPGPILAWPMASSLPATNADLFACQLGQIRVNPLVSDLVSRFSFEEGTEVGNGFMHEPFFLPPGWPMRSAG